MKRERYAGGEGRAAVRGEWTGLAYVGAGLLWVFLALAGAGCLCVSRHIRALSAPVRGVIGEDCADPDAAADGGTRADPSIAAEVRAIAARVAVREK